MVSVGCGSHSVIYLLNATSYLTPVVFSPVLWQFRAGQGMGQAILMFPTIVLVVLFVLNLIPFPWANVLLSFAILLINDVSKGTRDLIGAIIHSQSDLQIRARRYLGTMSCQLLLDLASGRPYSTHLTLQASAHFDGTLREIRGWVLSRKPISR